LTAWTEQLLGIIGDDIDGKPEVSERPRLIRPPAKRPKKRLLRRRGPDRAEQPMT
jgi:hypothetical protein